MGKECPIRFARYTGQDKEEAKQDVRNNPPHILLTNYVMLEYMLLRPWDRNMLRQATGKLRFLVADELHVYRGSQGADVAMLMRRLRQAPGATTWFVSGPRLPSRPPADATGAAPKSRRREPGCSA